ncbi:response regulator transcription factor [Rhodococcus pseudokoreensis]|uniref:Response regulator transcription factor n=1 Tax=Rhodococcus pseudokoreensis TaxID=2811421 RepID=A0A974VYY1_9NOCA|nr:response regulator transcription factor [Rhodococcus pseudokoreensis]QSE88124.1 response regulator transcription factor [Rhodococcus pseudokoreensis]
MPVVVLYDHDEVGAMVDAFDHGADDYMTKPGYTDLVTDDRGA